MSLCKISRFRPGHAHWNNWLQNFASTGWNTISLGITSNKKIYAYLNGKLVMERDVKQGELPVNGFVAIGTKDFGMAQFDDFSIDDLS